MKHPEY